MIKVLATVGLLGATLAYAQPYTGNGEDTQDSKKSACSKALEFAKVDAMEQAGTVVFSSFNVNNAYADDKTMKRTKEQVLSTMALGVAKLLSREELVKSTSNFQFTCSVRAVFEIDQKRFAKTFKEMMAKEEKKVQEAGYFQADANSADGQSKYAAITAATAMAQRNLLEIIKPSDFTSLTKIEAGVLTSDKIIKILTGKLVGIETVKKEYDKTTGSAYVVVRVKKSQVAAILKEGAKK